MSHCSRALTALVFGAMFVCRWQLRRKRSTLDRIVERGTLILGTSGNMPSMSQVDQAGQRLRYRSGPGDGQQEGEAQARVMPPTNCCQPWKPEQAMSYLECRSRRDETARGVRGSVLAPGAYRRHDEALAKAEQSANLNIADTRLVVLKGSTSVDFARELFSEATLIKVDDYAVAAELVRKDEARGLLTDFPVCLALIQANPDAGFVSVFSPLTYEPIGIALPAGDAHLINWMENFLDRMDGTKGLRELAARWFGKKAKLIRRD